MIEYPTIPQAVLAIGLAHLCLTPKEVQVWQGDWTSDKLIPLQPGEMRLYRSDFLVLDMVSHRAVVLMHMDNQTVQYRYTLEDPKDILACVAACKRIDKPL
jgi:hypothetical protein